MQRRRRLTDAERAAEDVANGKHKRTEERGKMKFMQKYYHKGVFYKDDEEVKEILERDYNLPTLEDNYNKEALPEIMQVKKFGRAGQTKWTHLAKEDTTQMDGAWMEDSSTRRKYDQRMAGNHSALERPKGKPKKKNA